MITSDPFYPSFATDVWVHAENDLSVASMLRFGGEDLYRNLEDWAPRAGPLSPIRQNVYWIDRYPTIRRPVHRVTARRVKELPPCLIGLNLD